MSYSEGTRAEHMHRFGFRPMLSPAYAGCASAAPLFVPILFV